MCTKAGYQEIFAEFIEGAKLSEAQWYSVKPLHQGIPNLADLLEVSSENLQILLTKAGIGNLGRNKLFSFQSSKFESFRSEYMLQEACETTRRRVKGLKTKQWVVRLCTNYLGDLADPGVNGRAPRVQNIRSLRKDFNDTISRLASSQQETEAASRPAPEEDTTTGCDTEQEEDSQQESDLVLLRVQRMLLPLHYTMKGTTLVPRCAHSFSTHRYRCALILLLPSSSRKLTSAVYSTHGLPSVPIRPPCAPFVHFETDVYLTHRMSDGTLRLSHVLFLSLTLFFFGVKCAYLTVLSYLQCSFGTH